jgi:hypothetical protein
MTTTSLELSTMAMCLFFFTNGFLCILFQVIRYLYPPYIPTIQENKKKEKELSKPFIGTLDCYTNLTLELFRTGMIMALTYICEKHWIFEHSGKDYSRDLFMFVLIVFFIYAIYTIKPCHDLTLLSREQTEEWKGWMQFIFLLYHYFHAEEVYNSVRVMITCYVWMTGFGNFSFFYMKQDYGWLRVVQMLWRLNFSVLLLMWTHANTYILYYICPMHTFYFLMVYATMYLMSSVNHSKWGIRVKLMILAIIIFIIWDMNGGIFDIVFSWLGTESVIGAPLGSVWEYYFRTSLDHWSSFLGMIFALNFPLAEQFFYKAKGWPLVLTSLLMAGATIWWLTNIYVQEKLEYNLTHAYYAIIPLTAYIFFRNITPTVRSGVSMSLHDLGKTTLETYLLQHHIWLTSNAKTLLTITPGHPWINFALATVLFFVTSKELYRLTMTLRGMIIPDDKNIAWINMWGCFFVLATCFSVAGVLHALSASLVQIILTSLGLSLVSILIINRFSRVIAENYNFQTVCTKAISFGAIALVVGIVIQLAFTSLVPVTTNEVKTLYKGDSFDCLQSISNGHWSSIACPTTNGIDKVAYCESQKWIWDNNSKECPVGKVSTTKARAVFKGKNVVFLGDSIIRGVYHQFNTILDPSYHQNYSQPNKHMGLTYKPLVTNTTVSFIWAPIVRNVTAVIDVALKDKSYNYIVSGAAAWDALYDRNINTYRSDLELLSNLNKDDKILQTWIQPTTIIDSRLQTPEKQQYMTEAIIKTYREAFLQSKAASKFDTVIDPSKVSAGREEGSVDGVHYSEEVYKVMAQMVSNAYMLHFSNNYAKTSTATKKEPKVTGAMSFPSYGAAMLVLSFIMIFTMDSWLGFGFFSLKLFNLKYDWDAAYLPLLKKISSSNSKSSLSKQDLELDTSLPRTDATKATNEEIELLLHGNNNNSEEEKITPEGV